MKRCPKCKEEKEIEQFYNDRCTKSRKSSHCKKCIDAVTKANYAKKHPKFVRYVNGLKICRVCLEPQPIENYNKHSHTLDGFRNDCKKCQSIHAKFHYWELDNDAEKAKRKKWYGENKELSHGYHLKKKFSIARDGYLKLLEEQGGKCKICGCDKPKGKNINFTVDHNHETGEIRGLLCHHCNVAIGFLHTPDLLRKAATYLETI